MSSEETFSYFLARQPILTRHRKFFAYEILSRHGAETYCRTEPGNSAKTIDGLFLSGVQTISEGLPAFLNCTREFLLNDYLTLMSKEMVVGEILETVTPDDGLLAACRRMKKRGHHLALNDYCDLPETRPLLDFADFVKIDVLLTSFEEQRRLVEQCHRRKIPVIADKVETDEQFRRCSEIGYDYFQGYFFCRPQTGERRSLSANKSAYLQLLTAANERQFNIQKLSQIFRRDVSLSYRLLRYLNSPVFGLKIEIRSIPHALTLLGEKQLRKWISLVSVAALGDEVADSLLRLPLLRARFCELIGLKIELHQQSSELFLLGLLSVMDALLNTRMSDVLAEIPVDDHIRKALLGEDSRYRPIFEVVLDYESGTWEQLADSARHVGLHEHFLPELYLQSVRWVREILADNPVQA
jgi:c-di-GMP-related signal transduction protein